VQRLSGSGELQTIDDSLRGPLSRHRRA
jgi:hypothetical protein